MKSSGNEASMEVTEASDSSRQLGLRLRSWFERSAHSGDAPLASQRLQALLLDAHEPCHGDPIVYEFLLRRQGFQALLAPLSKPFTRAQIQLRTLALLREAEAVFKRNALERMRAFLEGITGITLIYEAGTSGGQEEEQPKTTGQDMLIRQATATASSSSKGNERGYPHINPALPQSTRNPLFEAAVDWAIANHLIQPEQRSQIAGVHRGLFHIHLIDTEGRSIAKVHAEILKAMLRK